MLAERTSIVACYNYTGTPYVNKQVLPEVVYAYGLRESIWNGYLKDADPIAFENVKDTEFLRMAVTIFWERYGGKIYEGLNPKLAIYASRVEEAVNEVRPALEEILADLGIPTSLSSLMLARQNTPRMKIFETSMTLIYREVKEMRSSLLSL